MSESEIHIESCHPNLQGTLHSTTRFEPAYLYNLVSYQESGHLLYSFSQSVLHVPGMKTDFGCRAFSLLLHKSGTIYLLLSESHHHLNP